MHKIKIIGLPKAQNGKQVGNPDLPYSKTNPNGYLSMKNNQDWFDSHANWTNTGNKNWDAKVRQQVMTGRFGVDPNSGALIKLPQSEWVNITDEDKRLATDIRKWTPAQKQTSWEKKVKPQIVQSTKDLITNPVMMAPGAILTGGIAAGIPAVSRTAAAIAPALEAPLLGTLGAQYGTAALTGSNLLNSYFAYEATKHLPDVSDAWRNVYSNPSVDNIANVTAQTLGTGLAYLPMAASMINGMPSVLQDMSQTGNWLTTQTPLKNTYKINPWAEKLRNPNNSYRVAGLDALADFQNTGVLRSNPPYVPMDLSKGIIGTRPTSFPSFQKGFADLSYLPEEGGAIFETQLPTFKRGEFNPVTGNKIKGRHYAHRVIDPNTGYAMTEIPAADIKVYSGKPNWLKGFQEVPTPKSLSSSTETTGLDKFISSQPEILGVQHGMDALPPGYNAHLRGGMGYVPPATGDLAPGLIEIPPAPWSLEKQAGLHLQSTMANGPISKIVEPKTGLVNLDQALAIIGKESGGKEKLEFVKKGLQTYFGENIPKKIDFNDLRKLTQDQLIPLDRSFVDHSSNYGLGRINYPAAKRKSFEFAIENSKAQIAQAEEWAQINKDLPEEYHRLNNEILAEAKQNLQKNIEELKNVPLENQTLILSNEWNFGRGNHSHGNPKETLGHIHFLRDPETPDILTVTQIQSDVFQGSNKNMPKTLKEAMEKLKKTQEEVDDVETLMGHDRKTNEKVFANSYRQLRLDKAAVENFSQKSLLAKNHQERYIQELVNYAGERGDINKIRIPTSETAASVQGYKPFNPTEDALLNSQSFEEYLDRMRLVNNATEEQLTEAKRIYDNYHSNSPSIGSFESIFTPEQATILKKYSDYGSENGKKGLIEKLFGKKPEIVTDSKGNTWYEFDIPESFKGGLGDIKAFKEGGAIISTEGYKQGPPPPGSHYRIPSNTLYNPTPYKIKAVANTGETKILPPFNMGTVMFPGASHVDEYPMMKQGGQTDMICYDRNGKVRPCGPEDKLNKWLGSPMGKAERAAMASGEKWFNPQTKKWESEQMDNFRHPMAGRYTAEGIANKFPNWMQYTPIPKAAGFIGANALGIGHELMEPNTNPSYSIWDTIREGGEDAFNNMVGAGIGSLPFVSDATKTKWLQSLSDNNMLPDGIGKVDPKRNNGKPNLYKHAQGDLVKYQSQGKVTLPPTGTRPPIYTFDPELVENFGDSTVEYNKTLEIINPKYYQGEGDYGNAPSWYNFKGGREKADKFARKNNIDVDYNYYRTGKFPGKIQPIGTGDWGEGMSYPIYEKPVQPYILKKLNKQVTHIDPISASRMSTPGLRPMQHPNMQMSGAVPQGNWNVEYLDPDSKKTETKHFITNEDAEQFYNDPANAASRKYSNASSVGRMQEGGWLEQYQTKGQVTRPPIFTDNPNDPRLRAFNDSSYMNKYGETEKAYLQNPKTTVESWNNWHKKASNYRAYKDENNETIYGVLDGAEQAKRRLALYNYNTRWAKDKSKVSYPEGVVNEKDYNKAYFNYLNKGPIIRDFSEGTILGALGFGESGYSYQYSKPVQPVIYKKTQGRIDSYVDNKGVTHQNIGLQPKQNKPNYWTQKDIGADNWNRFIQEHPGAIGMDPYHLDKNGYHMPIYPSKPEPTLRPRVMNMQPIPFNRQSSMPGLKTMQQPNIELPDVQRGQYRTSYYDPQMKDWNERAFMSQQESDQFADEMSKRGYPGAYGNVTQRVQYKFGGSELKNGGLYKYQIAGSVCPPGFSKNAFGQCVNASGQNPNQAGASRNIISQAAQPAVVNKKPLATPFKNRSQVVQENTDRANRENYRLGEYSNQAAVGQARTSTLDDERERIRKNNLYASQNSNTAIDAQGNLSTVNPDRTMEGKALPYTRAAGLDKGMTHFQGAMDAAGLAIGVGELAHLGVGALRKGLTNSMESGLLSNTYKVNPWRFKPSKSAFYNTEHTAFDNIADQYGKILGKSEGKQLSYYKGAPRDQGGNYMVEHFPYQGEMEQVPFGGSKMQGYWDDLKTKPLTGEEMSSKFNVLANAGNDNTTIYKKDWLRGWKNTNPDKYTGFKSIKQSILPDLRGIANYPKELYLASKDAGKFTLPKYKDIYRLEPTTFAKDADQFSGRWFTDQPQDLKFYVGNKNSDPLVGSRILKERVPERVWKQNFGENMPLAAKQKSIGFGNFRSVEDIINSNTVSTEAARGLASGNLNDFTYNELFNNPSLYNNTEGIMPDLNAFRLRGLQTNRPFSPYTRIEGNNLMMPDIIDNLVKESFKSKKFGIPKQYLPFKEGGWMEDYDFLRKIRKPVNTASSPKKLYKKYENAATKGGWLNKYK